VIDCPRRGLRNAVGDERDRLGLDEVVGRERAVLGVENRLRRVAREVVRDQLRPPARRGPVRQQAVVGQSTLSHVGDAGREVELARLTRLDVVDYGHRHGPARPARDELVAGLQEVARRLLELVAAEPGHVGGAGDVPTQVDDPAAIQILGVVAHEESVAVRPQSIGAASAPTSPISRFRGFDPSASATYTSRFS